MSRVLAQAFAAAILIAPANGFSFLSFSIRDLESSVTLYQAPEALWDLGMPGLSIMVAAFIIVIPAMVLSLLAPVSALLHWAPADFSRDIAASLRSLR